MSVAGGAGAPARETLLRRAHVLALLTVAWNILEGVVAVAAGAVAGSLALIGFGLDSFVETASGLVVGWRAREELRSGPGERAERIERLTARIAGGLLLLLAAGVLFEAGRRLLGPAVPAGESPVGIVLTALSLVAMPLLGWAKLRTARGLGSRALRADAFETITCAWLSATTLAGLALNARFHWWWVDPAAAVLLVPLIAREGLEGLRGEESDE